MSDADDPLKTVRGQIRLAGLLWLVVIAGFGGWAATAPLQSAAVAPGFVGVEGNRKTIQHLEGGIIAEIAVAEGDQVAEGDLLLRLDSTVARSTYQLLEGQYIDMLAEKSRLEAERVGAEGLVLDPRLTTLGQHTRVDAAIRAQADLFESRRRAYANRLDILAQRIRSLEEQIRGLVSQQESTREQREILDREIASVAHMVARGLEREPRLLALQRAQAELEGLAGEITARRAQSEVRIGETRLEMIDLESRVANEVAGGLRDLAGRIADMEPRLRAAADRLRRTEIRAPQAGTIVALNYHTIGGVIAPGGPILDLVPQDSDLIIEAQVSLADIDIVRLGLPAEVRLTALSARTNPTLPGSVVHVSADRLTDRRTQNAYYAVHVRVGAEAVVERDSADMLAELYPGMPVEVLLVVGERTVLEYLSQPIVDIFARAFKEG